MGPQSRHIIGEVLIRPLLFMTIAILAVASEVQATEFYHWKDNDGNVYLSDTPPGFFCLSGIEPTKHMQSGNGSARSLYSAHALW